VNIEIVDKKGWKYARIKKPFGQGRAFCQSLGTKSEEAARVMVRESKLEQIQLAAQADALTREVWTRLLAGRKVRVQDAADAFCEHRAVIGRPAAGVRQDRIALDRFFRSIGIWIPNNQINVITEKHVSDFVNRPGDVKLQTRQWDLNLVKVWLGFCVDRRWIVSNPAIGVSIRLDRLSQEQLVNKPHEALTEDEIKRLLASIPRSSFWHGAILLAYEYGLTIGTVALLEDTNVVAYTLRVYRTKGRRLVNERLTDDLIAWLEEWRTKYRPHSDLAYIFPEQAAAYEYNPTTLSKQFRRLCDAVDIPGKSFHGLRKTATARRWSAELDELGDVDKRRLMALVAQNGFRAVQAMLAHAPGSNVTEKNYMPRS